MSAVPEPWASAWRWRNFTPEELTCRGTGQIVVVPEFMDKLQRLRTALGFPFPVTSGYRAPEYNAKVSTTGLDGPHTTGRAVDLRLQGEEALRVIARAGAFGFTGIGVKQHGALAGRFVHLDDLWATSRRPRPWIWSYP